MDDPFIHPSIHPSISNSFERNNFDDIRLETYHEKSFPLVLEKLPPTLSSIHIHIKEAFLQCHLWLHVFFVNYNKKNPEDHGYELTVFDALVPTITSKGVIPGDFPLPFNYLKCAKKNICLYRVKLINCCKFFKCGASSSWNNSSTRTFMDHPVVIYNICLSIILE